MRTRTLLSLGVACVAVSVAVPGSAGIYRWTDENGQVHFTSDPMKVPDRHRGKAGDAVHEKPPPLAAEPVPEAPPPSAGAPESPPASER